MSSGGAFGLEIRVMATLIKALVDLGKEYHTISSMRTTDGKIHTVELMTTDDSGRVIGFQKTEKGDYAVIADCAGLSPAHKEAQDAFVKRIRQRYSYNRVIEELKEQGYVIAEEEQVQNNTIRLVARKWA